MMKATVLLLPLSGQGEVDHQHRYDQATCPRLLAPPDVLVPLAPMNMMTAIREADGRAKAQGLQSPESTPRFIQGGSVAGSRALTKGRSRRVLPILDSDPAMCGHFSKGALANTGGGGSPRCLGSNSLTRIGSSTSPRLLGHLPKLLGSGGLVDRLRGWLGPKH